MCSQWGNEHISELHNKTIRTMYALHYLFRLWLDHFGGFSWHYVVLHFDTCLLASTCFPCLLLLTFFFPVHSWSYELCWNSQQPQLSTTFTSCIVEEGYTMTRACQVFKRQVEHTHNYAQLFPKGIKATETTRSWVLSRVLCILGLCKTIETNRASLEDSASWIVTTTEFPKDFASPALPGKPLKIE